MNHDPALATAADYADALITARRAKNLVLLVLLLTILGQLGLFFAARYTTYITGSAINSTAMSATTVPTTQAASWSDLLHYFCGVSAFLGVSLSILLSLILLLIAIIMLVGRLIGVGRVISSFVWCLLVIVLLFPWQAFLMDGSFSSREFIVPGVLFTWDELIRKAQFSTEPLRPAILGWARFVAWPLVTLIMLLVIQGKSNRGLKQALGEADMSLDILPPNS